MNAERLLKHYEKIADAPDAIPRLRRFVLDLAVRGKLVPQDPNDEPASELLTRIAKEKLDQAGLPQGWRRAKIGSILEFQYGKGLKASQRLDEGLVPVFGSNGIVGFTGEALTVHPSIIVGRKGSAGALNICDGPSWTTDVAYFVEAPSFLDLWFLLSALAALDLDKLGKGVKPGLSRSEAYDQIIAIPPLAEQHRIVAKVDELMALCDRLEAARQAREAMRDRLTAASLARLNAPDPDTFRDDARFALDALPALTARADQIRQLRQTILNLAVRGKLVPQDPNDEPVREVILEIVVKGRGQIREQIAAPFALPKGWSWRAVGTIARQVTDGEHATPPRISEAQVPLITAKNVRDGFMDYSQTDWVSKATAEKAWNRCRPSVGDLLLVCVGATTGRLTVLREPQEMVLVRSVALIRPNSEVDAEYLDRAVRSPVVQEQIWASVKAAAQPCLYINRIQSLLIPLPPLAEQHRIVAKVDELMALCDRLEDTLINADTTRQRLLESLLHEALAPNSNSEMMAAE